MTDNGNRVATTYNLKNLSKGDTVRLETAAPGLGIPLDTFTAEVTKVESEEDGGGILLGPHVRREVRVRDDERNVYILRQYDMKDDGPRRISVAGVRSMDNTNHGVAVLVEKVEGMDMTEAADALAEIANDAKEMEMAIRNGIITDEETLRQNIDGLELLIEDLQ